MFTNFDRKLKSLIRVSNILVVYVRIIRMSLDRFLRIDFVALVS